MNGSRIRAAAGLLHGRTVTARGHWVALALLVLCVAVAIPRAAQAQEPFVESKPFAEHFLLLQLSDGEPRAQGQVLSVAANLIENYGPDLIDIEVVTFARGIELLYADNERAETVDSLAAQGVRFIVCMNTVDTIVRQTGEAPELNDTAIPVQVGVAHILERVEDGYTLVRP